jgi:hypothetical protein
MRIRREELKCRYRVWIRIRRHKLKCRYQGRRYRMLGCTDTNSGMSVPYYTYHVQFFF